MKAKLLKQLRGDAKYKFKEGKCHLFMNLEIYSFDSISSMVRFYYHEKSNKPFIFGLNWDRVYWKHFEKQKYMKFRKL
jgi:hypothetical protein